ncbi:hypothetical protein JL721_2598 [Aureococcus anophagefferens]|nr:hypothetical protein JL721_2598 [Aureococcus anophagefferens]
MAPPVTPVKGGAPGAASPPRARAPRWANTTRWLRAHGDGVLLESSEPGLAPLLLTSNKAGVVAKVVQPVKVRRPASPESPGSQSDGDLSPAGKRPKSPKKSPKFGFGKKKAKAPDAPAPAPAPPSPEADDDAYEWATPELAHEASGRVPCEAVLGVYEMTSGPHVAVVLSSEPVLRRGGDAALLDDARLRWPKAVLDVRALRRATKVGVLPVAPKSAKRLNSKQKADEKLCLRLLHGPSASSPGSTARGRPRRRTAPRVCELADVAAAEAAAVVANDGVRRRGDVDDDAPDRGGDSYLYDHADPRMLWNAIPLKALVDAGAARWCAVAGHVVVDAVDLGATAAGDAAVVALIVTRTAVDHCGRRLSKRGLDAQCKAAATAETELLVATSKSRAAPAAAFSVTLARSSPPLPLDYAVKVAPRVALLKRKSSFANLASPQRKPSLTLRAGRARAPRRRRARGADASASPRRPRAPSAAGPKPAPSQHARDVAALEAHVDQLRATYGGAFVTMVDLIARTAAWASVDGGRQESVRQRLKAAAAVLASAARGAKVRHVVVAPGADLGDLSAAHDVRRRRVASRGAAAEPGGVDVSGVVLFVGCDEIDDVDEAMARCACDALVAARDDAALGPDRVALGDEAYARRQLLAAWRGHADALAVLRAGTAARWAPAAVGGAAARLADRAGGWAAAAVRGLRAAIYDGSRQDGLDLVVGRKAPADAVAGADAATYAHERIDVAYLKVAAAVFAVAAALRSQAGDARPAAILQHALLAVLAAIVLTFDAAFADGSLATAHASARRFDDH